jgi:hypothetical protein
VLKQLVHTEPLGFEGLKKCDESCGLDYFGSRYGPVLGSFEDDNKFGLLRLSLLIHDGFRLVDTII